MLRSGVLSFATILCLFISLPSPAQSIFHRLKKAAEDKVESSASKSSDSDSTPADTNATPAATSDATPAASPNSATASATPATVGGEPNLVSVPIDFIPGEKVIFYDDFSDMPPGEPPPHWTVRNGMMQLRMGSGVRELYTKESDVNITSPSLAIPTNFTFQLVCVCQGRSHWSIEDKDGNEVFGMEVEGSADGATITAYVSGPDNAAIGSSGDVKTIPGKPDELDLWAQQGRVRVYLNGQRFGDVNNIKFAPLVKVYAGAFSYRPTGIRSVRVAESAPDPGTMLATTGKYVTHGIYFDTNSDVLKPESAPVIKEISTALYKNQGMKLEIDGYTDSTGDAAHNLDLSKRRAASVKNVLVSQFGIDQSRLTSNGFGVANPIGSNDTADGRAQNRRVEFVKK